MFRPVDIVRGTAFALQDVNKAAKDYLKQLVPGSTDGIVFIYGLNLAKRTCCGGFIYCTVDKVSVLNLKRIQKFCLLFIKGTKYLVLCSILEQFDLARSLFRDTLESCCTTCTTFSYLSSPYPTSSMILPKQTLAPRIPLYKRSNQDYRQAMEAPTTPDRTLTPQERSLFTTNSYWLHFGIGP